jgi:hypothetical protein
MMIVLRDGATLTRSQGMMSAAARGVVTERLVEAA